MDDDKKVGILPDEFTSIETYEDCPIETELLVWTGDSFEVEHVALDGDSGTYYPANGIEFSLYIELPRGEDVERINQ